MVHRADDVVVAIADHDHHLFQVGVAVDPESLEREGDDLGFRAALRRHGRAGANLESVGDVEVVEDRVSGLLRLRSGDRQRQALRSHRVEHLEDAVVEGVLERAGGLVPAPVRVDHPFERVVGNPDRRQTDLERWADHRPDLGLGRDREAFLLECPLQRAQDSGLGV